MLIRFITIISLNIMIICSTYTVHAVNQTKTISINFGQNHIISKLTNRFSIFKIPNLAFNNRSSINLEPTLNPQPICNMEKLVILITSVSLCFFLVLTIFLVNSKNKLKIANRKIKENLNFIADQHEEILIQFELIKRKNKELNKYRDHLEKIDKNMMHKLDSVKEKAKESDRLKSTIISNIYHEIRTPLNAIMGFIQLISVEEDLKNKHYIEIIEKNADDLLLLVDNMIEFSKLQTKATVLSITEISIKELLEIIYNETVSIRRAYKKHNIDIDLALDELSEDETIFTDKEKLYKILKQLVDNALKYTREGRISIGCTRNAGSTSFFISDTGTGIENEKLPSIFNAFHKIEDHDNLTRGIGIGLAIVKQLASQIRGEIQVASELKKGTKFTLQIPDMQPVAAN